MDLVLGLSMTSSAVRWVLVEETTAEGATSDRGAFDLTEGVDPHDLLDVLPVNESDKPIHAIGVTWTNEAEEAASGVLEALAARGHDNVIAVSELEAGDVLASGIAGIAEHDDMAVCIIEPDAAVVAVVNADGVSVDRIARPKDGADAVELPSSVLAMLELDDWRPEAIFVVGSAEDLDLIVSTLDGATESPVISAADADLALARGAALASARAVNAMAAAGPQLPTKLGALTSLLAAAVVTFVVSLSIAVGLTFAPDPPEQPQAANAVDTADDPTAVAAEPTEPPKQKVMTPAEARPVLAQTIAVAAPPPPAAPAAEPVYDPPQYAPPPPADTPPAPAYTPPAPAYVPPPPQPAYVPPPQPRLRDRIIERIPIINRFHEPEYPYPR